MGRHRPRLSYYLQQPRIGTHNMIQLDDRTLVLIADGINCRICAYNSAEEVN